MKVYRAHNNSWDEAIVEALLKIPQSFHKVLGTCWSIGFDPVATGVHNFGDEFRAWAHCCFPWHLSCPQDDSCLIVLPTPTGYPFQPKTVVHELGHVLHYRLDFDRSPVPVSEYAKTNNWEAFAEAFTCYVYGKEANRGLREYWDLTVDDWLYFRGLEKRLA